jgi:predicted nuclease of predicted toxin-antitoxin system
MKFLIDAQLPRRLAIRLRQSGADAIHTLDLPDGNRTADSVINELSIKGQYVVVTKDADFVETLLLRAAPSKLLLISTGNIGNEELEALFFSSLERVADGFESFDFIELNRTTLIFHL